MAENTIIHEISLAGYKATSTGGMLDLGTWGSYGIEKLHLTLDAAWQDLTITAFFNVNGEVVAKRVVGKDGYADVPWEATKENTFSGCLAFEGSINGQRRISTNLNYKVTNHSETTDSDPVPTDDRWNQFVTETKKYRDGAFEAAKRANARAEDAEAASEDAQAAARAAKASENAAAASASNAAADAAKAGPYAKAAQAAQEAAENAAAAAAASKSAADTLAAEAARAAQAAENSKAAANNAADLAGENATAAQQAADTATAAANDAGQSASDAAASKAAAETAAKATQDAQTAAAAAKAEAVKAQEAAQTAAKSAQDAQAAAEKARDEVKAAQKGAEAARDTAAKSAEAAAKSEANAKQSADTLAESVENVVANTAAVAELKEKKAEIDDTAVRANAWSSKHIVDMLCPPLEESGNPVVCYPVAGYPLGVKASWEPMQEGTGTPSPENIRPIKGRDSVNVERCGENLFKFPYSTSTARRNGLVITSQQDGGITVNGTATADTWYAINQNIEKRLPMNTPMALSGCPAGGSTKTYYIGLYLGGKWFSDSGNGNTDVKFTTREIASRVEVSIIKGTVCNNLTFFPKIEVGTTITPYSKYQGSTNTLTLPETVYGGEVDAVTGDGKETWKTITLDGTEDWSFQTTNSPGKSGFVFQVPEIATPENPGIKGDIVCSQYPTVTANDTYQCINGISVESQEHHYFRIYNDTYAGGTINEWKHYLAAQHEAGTPVQVCYKLAEPVPFTATGAQALPALAGLNTVLTDADSATVTGRADPIKRIADLEAAVASIN